MLTLEEIKKEYSETIFGRNPRGALVEYLQYEMLDSLFKQKDSAKLSFIGGTAVRIVYGGNRFSEDLDFDNFGLSFTDFQKVLKMSIEDMRNKGFKIEVRFVKKKAYHAYVKFPDLLFENNLSKHVDEKILVRVDAVRKKKIIQPKIFVLDGFSVYKKILVNPMAVILSQKIIAILERKRTKGRDFFDVSFLLSRVDPDYKYLKEYGIKNRQDLKNRLLEKISKTDLKSLAKDVEPFLINPDEKERVSGFREYIEQKL